MGLLRPLFEAWLLDATQEALPAWKRRLLARALAKDEALRCLAAELAQFSHEPQAPAGLKAPDLRPRLRALLPDQSVERPLFPNAWVPGAAIACLLFLALVAALQRRPSLPSVDQAARVMDAAAAAAMAPTPAPSATSTPAPVASVALSPTATTAPASKSGTAQ